jgi:hypothetical protein
MWELTLPYCLFQLLFSIVYCSYLQTEKRNGQQCIKQPFSPTIIYKNKISMQYFPQNSLHSNQVHTWLTQYQQHTAQMCSVVNTESGNTKQVLQNN